MSSVDSVDLTRVLWFSSSYAECFHQQNYICIIQGASTKTDAITKMLIEQSWYLKSGHLYSYFNDSCLLTKTKLKHFKNYYFLVLNLFLKCFYTIKFLVSGFFWCTLYTPVPLYMYTILLFANEFTHTWMLALLSAGKLSQEFIGSSCRTFSCFTVASCFEKILTGQWLHRNSEFYM